MGFPALVAVATFSKYFDLRECKLLTLVTLATKLTIATLATKTH